MKPVLTNSLLELSSDDPLFKLFSGHTIGGRVVLHIKGDFVLKNATFTSSVVIYGVYVGTADMFKGCKFLGGITLPDMYNIKENFLKNNIIEKELSIPLATYIPSGCFMKAQNLRHIAFNSVEAIADNSFLTKKKTFDKEQIYTYFYALKHGNKNLLRGANIYTLKLNAMTSADSNFLKDTTVITLVFPKLSTLPTNFLKTTTIVSGLSMNRPKDLTNLALKTAPFYLYLKGAQTIPNNFLKGAVLYDVYLGDIYDYKWLDNRLILEAITMKKVLTNKTILNNSVIRASITCSYSRIYAFKNATTRSLYGPGLNTPFKRITSGEIYYGYIYADGVLSKILHTKTLDDFTIYVTTDTNHYNFLVRRGDVFAHGYTLKSAMRDLDFKFKREERTAKIRACTKDTVFTKEEAIELFRNVTGACQAGTNHFLRLHPEFTDETTFILADILNHVKGEFGYRSFYDFCETKGV